MTSKFFRSENAFRNLALGAGLVFFISLTALQMRYHFFAADLVSFWSVGRIANDLGYSKIYNLATLAEYQNKTNPLDAIPSAFPAVFIIPFQGIALFPFFIGAWLWRFFVLGLCVFYCIFFARQMGFSPQNNHILFALLLSLPVYINFAWGQVNVFMMIGLGEFFRLSSKGEKFAAGAALGLALIKPQTLMLILPFLLYRKEWKTLAGFSLSAALIFVTSFSMCGWDASLQWLTLLGKFSAGLRAGEPEHMVNWRMVGIQLAGVFSTPAGEIFSLTGIALTGASSMFAWRKSSAHSALPSAYLFLNLLAATLLVSWHAHLHYMVILLPPLILIANEDNRARQFMDHWIFSGMGLYLLILLLGVFPLPEGIGTTLLSLWGFLSSLTLFLWSLKKIFE